MPMLTTANIDGLARAASTMPSGTEARHSAARATLYFRAFQAEHFIELMACRLLRLFSIVSCASAISPRWPLRQRCAMPTIFHLITISQHLMTRRARWPAVLDAQVARARPSAPASMIHAFLCLGDGYRFSQHAL